MPPIAKSFSRLLGRSQRSGLNVNSTLGARAIARGHRHYKAMLAWAVVALAFAQIFGKNLYLHLRRAATSIYVNDDVRQQIFPFFRFEDPQLFRNDYIAKYYEDILPIGYRAVYTVAAQFKSAIALSKLLPYLLLAVVVIALTAAARRLSGPVAAVMAAALVLGNPVYLQRLAGGLPRAFAFPTTAILLYTLASGNAVALAVLTCIIAGFYPVVAVVAGCCLSMWLLLLPSGYRGSVRGWSFRRRVGLLALTAIGSCLALLPQTASSHAYGGLISVTRLHEFPEIGVGGRYSAEDRAPFLDLGEAMYRTAQNTLFSTGSVEWPRPLSWSSLTHQLGPQSIVYSTLLAMILVWLFSLKARKQNLRILLLPASVAVGYELSTRFAPHLFLPQRYIIYTLPPLLALMMASSAEQLVRQLSRFPGALRACQTSALCLLLFLQFGGTGSATAGLGTRLRADNPLLLAATRLAPNALLGAWPSGVVDDIPYCARRRVFVSMETHQAFHEKYTLEMRRRVHALIDAYSATDDEPILRLYREFGVTHLLFTGEFVNGNIPRYFRPFDTYAHDAARRLSGRKPRILQHLEAAAVYRDNQGAILSLRQLANSQRSGHGG